jgi:hypothetical protein
MGAFVGLLVLVALLAGGAAAPRAERVVGDLRIEMSVSKAASQPGHPVAVTMRVTNTTAEPLVLTASSGQQYEVVVRQRGALVWQWSHDKAFTQAIRSLPLAAQETLTYQATWDQRDLQGRPVEPGIYEISSVLMVRQRPGSGNIEVGPVRITIGR